MITSTAFAYDDVTATISNDASSTSQSKSAGYSQAEAYSNGVNAYKGVAAGRDVYTVHSTGSDLSNMVPNATAPNLATTLTETCMGSSSAGASGAGFGFSIGTTWRDSACVRRLDARQLSAFGDLATAREMMCDSDKVREAAARAGKPCVADGGVPWGIPVAIAVPGQVVPTEEAAAPVVNQQVRQ